ncbi:hypothetical protein [Sphingomonas flavalba]|uniref:hypothetical protein n=1 Tax=Sphingomonas flavalba TaxID=2559804 RepID=UPI00109DECB2|nr:hypothetical protein [Sphingomonas flavalba]
MKHAAALVLALVPCPALAAPVYLKCQLAPGTKGGAGGQDLAASAPMDITLNEDAGTVTYAFPTAARAYTVRGIFTAEQVTFNGFSVDRTNLAFQRSTFGVVDRGQCTLVEVKRAF